MSLVVVALGIVRDSLARLQNMAVNPQPGYSALIVATRSAFLKEGIYRYTIRFARRLCSRLLEANAWHSRSDAFSSLVVIPGTGGAIAGIRWSDLVAAIVVAGLIIHVAWKIGREGFNEPVDTGVSEGHRIGDAVVVQLMRKFPGLRGGIVHNDPEDDGQIQPSINLPLGPEIADAVRAAFESLQDNWAHVTGRFPFEYCSALPRGDTVGRDLDSVDQPEQHGPSQEN